MPPPTTMKRIAGELGVSITTVSKVLNNQQATSAMRPARASSPRSPSSAISPTPSPEASRLRRTHTLGIVIPDLMHSFFVEIVAGIEPVARSRAATACCCAARTRIRARSARKLEMLQQRQVDGVVLASVNASGNTDLLQRLAAQGIGAGDDRSRRSSRRQVRSRRDRRRAGRRTGHEPSPRTGAQGDRAHRAGRRSSTPGARTAG